MLKTSLDCLVESELFPAVSVSHGFQCFKEIVTAPDIFQTGPITLVIERYLVHH